MGLGASEPSIGPGRPQGAIAPGACFQPSPGCYDRAGAPGRPRRERSPDAMPPGSSTRCGRGHRRRHRPRHPGRPSHGRLQRQRSHQVVGHPLAAGGGRADARGPPGTVTTSRGPRPTARPLRTGGADAGEDWYHLGGGGACLRRGPSRCVCSSHCCSGPQPAPRRRSSSPRATSSTPPAPPATHRGAADSHHRRIAAESIGPHRCRPAPVTAAREPTSVRRARRRGRLACRGTGGSRAAPGLRRRAAPGQLLRRRR